MASKSVRMPERWPARVVTVTSIGHLDGSWSVALLLVVDDPRWRGPPLRWECELDDPQFVRLVEVSGCRESYNILERYPVTVWLEKRSGYFHVMQLEPAPAGRSRNGLHWERLDQPERRIDPEDLLRRGFERCDLTEENPG